MPGVSLASPEELFRERVIRFMVKKGLLPPDRASILRCWRRSLCNIQSLPPRNRQNIERLAQQFRGLHHLPLRDET
jgi:hypothetical protein